MMNIERISSKDNPLIKELKLLQTPGSKGQKARISSGKALLEGIHLIQAWMCSSDLDTLLTTDLGMQNPEIAQAVYAHLEACPQTRIFQLEQGLWSLFAGLVNAPQIAGLINIPQSSLLSPTQLFTIDGDVLILDRIQDAGNVGAILRTTAAAGFTQVIALSGTAQLWSSKVLRAGMGAHRLLNLSEGWSNQQILSSVTAPLFAATADANLNLFSMDKVLAEPVAWIMGSEGQGVSEDLMLQAKGVAIPINPLVESLNVSTAAAVCLFETMRVRRSSI
jgi:RNA methyltransferase, TrmH family|uniref:TrmH family RNA methyltransferase n=1 Tax=Polynucleobacter sp. TaxID=2029855 RepID=UPI004047A938